MKKLKRWLSMILCCATACAGGGCAPGKQTKPTAPAEKQVLLFEVDEGLGLAELTTVFGSDRAMLDRALYNIADGLSPLKANYDVAVLIYPTWHYFNEGFAGKDPAQPLNRVSDDLKYVLDFFDAQDFGVYLELVSSGIDTSQNGEVLDHDLKPKPMPPLHYGEERVYNGLSMDMETLTALYRSYPALVGVRFHELIGSHDLGVAGNNHGFVVYEEMLSGIFETVRDTGMELVWGDHSWNTVKRADGSLVESKAFWQDWLDMAVDTIGTDKLTLNWSNNGWPAAQYVNDTFRYKNYRGTQNGESVQSWFWQELDCGTMRWKPNGTGNWQTKWYKNAANDMPIELIGAFTLRALEGGARLVQYEHPQYFFNFPIVKTVNGEALSSEDPAYCEGERDYSVRLRTKRLIEMLLHPDRSDNPSSDLTDYFADAFDNIVDYTTSNTRAKRYLQTTLTVGGGEFAAPRTFDTFNSAPAVWEEHSENRYPVRQFDAGVAFAVRMNLTFSAIDETLVLKKNGGGLIGEYYNHYGGLILTDRYTFLDNGEGSVVGVVPVNLFADYQSGLEGDPDDLVIVRAKDGRLSARAYRTVSTAAGDGYTFQPVEASNADPGSFLGGDANAADYLGSVSYRAGSALNADCTRPLDAGVLSAYRTAGGLKLRGRLDGRDLEQTLNLGGAEAVAVACGDVDADYEDELCVLVRDGGQSKIVFFDRGAAGFEAGAQAIALGALTPSYLTTARIGHYLRNY